jgi:hypothetical protein
LRMQLQEARFGSVGAPHGVYTSRKVA